MVTINEVIANSLPLSMIICSIPHPRVLKFSFSRNAPLKHESGPIILFPRK